VVQNPLLSGGPIITLVKLCYGAGKSVFGLPPAIGQWANQSTFSKNRGSRKNEWANMVSENVALL